MVSEYQQCKFKKLSKITCGLVVSDPLERAYKACSQYFVHYANHYTAQHDQAPPYHLSPQPFHLPLPLLFAITQYSMVVWDSCPTISLQNGHNNI